MSKDKPKGMSMEELRVAIDSEAQQKVMILVGMNKNLTDRLQNAQKIIKDRDEEARVLFNRCFAAFRDGMCFHCMLRARCAHNLTVGQRSTKYEGD